MKHLNQWRMSSRAKSGLEIQGKSKGGGAQKESGSPIAIGEVKEEGGDASDAVGTRHAGEA